MDFSLAPEQEQIRDTLRGFLADRYDFAARQTAVRGKAGWRPDIWRAFATELELLGLTLPARAGGLNGGPVETMLVMEELGRALVVEPYLETVVLGGHILARAGGAAAEATLAGIASGEAVLALAWEEPETSHEFASIASPAARAGDGWRLTGQKTAAIAAPWATHLLIAARTGGKPGEAEGLSLFLAPAAAPGIKAAPYPTIDGKRAADLTLDLVLPAAALIGPVHGALPLLEAARDAGIAAQSAEAVGVMRRLLEDTIAYTRQRRQFGQPIAQFQALQHRMADMYMQLEMAVSATYLAVLKQNGPALERAMACATAKVTVARAARFIGQNAVQLHGGMGMTDALPVSHYFKRATAIEMEFGSADYHLARYARLAAGGLAVESHPRARP